MDIKYQRIKCIGQGAFGKAYLVRNTEVDKMCVVKQMETGQMDKKDRDIAVQEALILKKMVHPNIVQFQDVFMTRKGKLCIVMEYADGGDVDSAIKKRNGELLSEQCILEWFVQVAFALLYVHDRKVLHRDLKTQNIFLMSTGQIKLGDFGIARVMEGTHDVASTMVGTPFYLSPEILQEQPYNHKTDVWSLGVILFEMASLTKPYNADNLVDLASKIVKGHIPPLDSRYSNDLQELVRNMLNKSARIRPTIREVLNHTFLKEPMDEANEKYNLGLDLSEFASTELPVTSAESVETGMYDGTVEGTTCHKDGDDLSEGEQDLKKSVSGSGVASSASKARWLRMYLQSQASADEFQRVYELVRTSDGMNAEELMRQVSEVVGASKASLLLPTFQLLYFLYETVASRDNERHDSILQVFRTWDSNKDGFITEDELSAVLTQIGLTTLEITETFVAADLNTDKKIDYEEFVKWLFSSASVTVSEAK